MFEATPWVNGAYLPDHAALQTYRVMAPMAYAKIKNIIERNVTSGLIYLPSSARDLNNPQIDKYLAKYVRGSNGMDHVERIKILKLMWDAIGSEFGGRHELYEINYSGSPGRNPPAMPASGADLRQHGQDDGDG
ncbi:4-hydroxyphenylacetate 3-monooxygenase oxygenase component [Leclercia adecarboxylata]|uniref:4-hydroxyphenylacetate 3-monooxygenase oxygenase component n=1 Tax=Leclercia adecarboxylata TaxID=83655 RepID=A0A4U9HJW6_9ENTR|nr:4-hydroxyphenylacetate 3-monooxygenase oxygenase component [Leclercia adecarboxylata]